MDKRLEKFRNKLIVLEGIDHSGKSTIARALKVLLESCDMDVILTKQPGDAGGELGALTRSMCIDKKWDMHPLSNLFAFLMDRTEHISKVVKPALFSGKTVICDRWSYSTIAYQFYGKQLIEKHNIDNHTLEWLSGSALLGVVPDYSFFIDRESNNILKSTNNDSDQFESESSEFKNRVYNAYKQMVKENILAEINIIEDDVIGTIEKIIEQS